MRYSIIALTAAGLLATPVLAQTPMAPKYVTIGASDALASNIVGLDVYNAGNENVGEIEDLRPRRIQEHQGPHPVGRRLPRLGGKVCDGRSRCGEGPL